MESTRRSACPPGPKAGFLGYEFRQRFQNDALGTAMQLRQEFDDVVYVRAGPFHWYMLNHPDHVKDVFVTRSKLFSKTDMFKRVIRSVDGNGLVASEGDFWLRQRRIIQPAFSHDSLRHYAVTMHEETARWTSSWKEGMTLDLATEMTNITLTIAARVFFSIDAMSDAQELAGAVNVLSRTMLQEFYDYVPLPDWLPLPSKLAKRKAIAVLDKLIQRSIQHHKEGKHDTRDMLSLLLSATDTESDGRGMSSQQVRDEAVTMFNAGHDSTAQGLTWCWYLLLKNGHAYESLLDALDVAPQDHSANVPIAAQVAKEALRLYPTAWTLPRQAAEDTELAGYRIPKGSLLNFFPYVMHRDERFFDEPERFKPERFSPENEPKIYPFSYFPFGAGPRACIGREFALMEMQIVLADISRKFRFELVDPQVEVKPVPLVSLEPSTPIMVTVKERRITACQT